MTRRVPQQTPFGVIAADPPWQFSDHLPGKKRGAAKHYPCLTVSQIARFPLPPIADDSVLLLWRVAAMLEEALFVCRAWGFQPKSEIVWVKAKRGANGSSRYQMGMGRTVRNVHETAILATRGRPTRLSASELSVVVASRGIHSAKPDDVYKKIERLYPGPYAELFARQERPGWTCFGDEIAKGAPGGAERGRT